MYSWPLLLLLMFHQIEPDYCVCDRLIACHRARLLLDRPFQGDFMDERLRLDEPGPKKLSKKQGRAVLLAPATALVGLCSSLPLSNSSRYLRIYQPVYNRRLIILVPIVP